MARDQDVAAWDAVEADWSERVDRLALLDVVSRLQETRLRAARVADGELARAIAKAERTRKELTEATTLLEDTLRLASMGRT